MRAWIGQHPLRVIFLIGSVVAVVAFSATAWRAPGAPGDFLDFGRGGTVKLSPYAER